MDYIYIFRSYIKNGSLLKFGYSKDAINRKGQYYIHNPGIEVVYVAQLENANKIELEFHSKNKATIGNEWYEDTNTMLSNMHNYLSKYKHIDCTNDKIPLDKQTCYFKDVVLECKKGDSDYYLWACKKYPFLADAIKYLGYDKIEQLDYHLNNIKKSVVKFSSDTKETQIKKLLETEYKISKGHFVSNKDLKTILDRIYKELKINKIAKSTDITQFYKVKIAQKFVINAVTKLKEKVNGIIIL